jgi:hypothetical protein
VRTMLDYDALPAAKPSRLASHLVSLVPDLAAHL